MKIRSHFDLRIWKEAHALTLEIYRLTDAFPVQERYGLVAQMRRAASSVAATIIEGTGRSTTRDFIDYLFMARGSTHEMMQHIMLAKDLRYLRKDVAEIVIGRYKGLAAGIYACIMALQKRNSGPR